MATEVIYIDSAPRRKEVLELLRRGLNVWEGHPLWMEALYDELLAESKKNEAIAKENSRNVIPVVDGAGGV